MASNPYTPPRAQVADMGSDEVQEVKVWSAQGRIGRLRYLAYSVASALVTYGVLIACILVLGPMTGAIAIFVLTIPLMVFGILIAIQRAHDMDWSGWMILLMLIPLVGFLWLFKSGTQGTNRFGAPPPPNTTSVKVLAFLAPVLVAVIGILAAIALPAYQDYVRRAQEAQQLQQP